MFNRYICDDPQLGEHCIHLHSLDVDCKFALFKKESENISCLEELKDWVTKILSQNLNVTAKVSYIEELA